MAALSEVESLALQLDPKERSILVSRLAASLDLLDEDTADLPPLSEEWLAVIERRGREIDEGIVQPVPYVDPVVRLERMRGGQ